MSTIVTVAKVDELQDSTMREVLVQGHEILLARVGDKFYAADNRCSHMSGKLAQGKLEGTIVTCPRHSSQFDLTDGHVVRWLKGSGLVAGIAKVLQPPHGIATYAIKIENGNIMIEI